MRALRQIRPSVHVKEFRVSPHGALVNAERFDLIENVLRGFNPSGRIYAARELLKLNKEGRLVLGADTLAIIAKISNLDIEITTVSGCLVNRIHAKDILDDLDH